MSQISRKKSVSDRVVGVIVFRLNDKDTSQIAPQTDIIKDLGADGMDVIDLVCGLESEFGIKIPDDAFPNANLEDMCDEDYSGSLTVQQTIDYIKGCLAKAT